MQILLVQISSLRISYLVCLRFLLVLLPQFVRLIAPSVAQIEQKNRGSLASVQKLRLLDENPAVSLKKLGIRKWTIKSVWVLAI